MQCSSESVTACRQNSFEVITPCITQLHIAMEHATTISITAPSVLFVRRAVNRHVLNMWWLNVSNVLLFIPTSESRTVRPDLDHIIIENDSFFIGWHDALRMSCSGVEWDSLLVHLFVLGTLLALAFHTCCLLLQVLFVFYKFVQL